MKLFSIIVATYNAEKFLETLLQSIAPQKSGDVELILIDGGSKDSTNEIIEKYASQVDYHVSEKDKGIYDAWNKGISVSTGDWIMFLGADDALVEGALDLYRQFLHAENHSELEYISSKVQMVDKNRKPIWVSGDPWSWPLFQLKMTVAHPGSLHARRLFEKYGVFNIMYKIVGDYELLLRPLNGLKTAYLNAITVNMMEGGVSDSWPAIKETIKAVTKSGQANIFIANFMGIYVYIKSRINKVGRVVGVNLNRRR